VKTIKELPKTKRPRERLEYLGVSNLTEIELISLLLGTGGKGENVIERSSKLLHTFPLTSLATTSMEQFINNTTVGKVQAGKIVAAIELGRRIFSQQQQVPLTNPTLVVNEVKDIITKSQEYLLGLYLNARHELIEKHIVAVGSLNQAIIEPRDILYHAVKLPASYIILVHNHPSGDPTPSNEDKRLTKHIVEASSLLGVIIVDHIIVAKRGYTSFREESLL
jgi:DNA repair protein RadC